MKIFIAILHLIILLAALTSPFWIDWKLVLAGFAIYIIQKHLFKGCLLSFAEFGSERGRPKNYFTAHYLIKIFKFKLPEENLAQKLDIFLAPAIPLIAIVIQLIFSFKPLIQISL